MDIVFVVLTWSAELGFIIYKWRMAHINLALIHTTTVNPTPCVDNIIFEWNMQFHYRNVGFTN
jgi:hypothetical protein